MDMASFHPHPSTSKSQLPSILSDIFSEGNLSNILKTISIDISVKHGVVEYIQIRVDCSPEEIQLYTALFKELCDVFTWSYKEMPGIDPRIIVHEIKTYPSAHHVRQCLRSVHPKKVAAIKVEVEKLLNVAFIYHVPD